MSHIVMGTDAGLFLQLKGVKAIALVSLAIHKLYLNRESLINECANHSLILLCALCTHVVCVEFLSACRASCMALVCAA